MRSLFTLFFIVGSTATASAADENREDGIVRVMTRNLYLGSSLDGLLNARSFPELIAAAAQVKRR